MMEDIWKFIIAMVVGGVIMVLGVFIGAAIVVGSRNTESEGNDRS